MYKSVMIDMDYMVWRVGRVREPWERSEGGVNDNEWHLHTHRRVHGAPEG